MTPMEEQWAVSPLDRGVENEMQKATAKHNAHQVVQRFRSDVRRCPRPPFQRRRLAFRLSRLRQCRGHVLSEEITLNNSKSPRIAFFLERKTSPSSDPTWRTGTTNQQVVRHRQNKWIYICFPWFFLWDSIGFRRIPWDSVGFHRIPLDSV